MDSHSGLAVYCAYLKLNNLAHLDKEKKKVSLIQSVELMDENDCHEVVFLSMYDHPHELVCTGILQILLREKSNVAACSIKEDGSLSGFWNNTAPFSST